MFSRIFAGTSIALALFAALCWHKWGHWKDVAGTWKAEAGEVVKATKAASGNDKLDWKTTPGQIVALGQTVNGLKLSIAAQNERIDDMAAEAVQLKARASELKRIADQAQAQRRTALSRLSNLSITPGTRSDCMALLKEAENALDLVRSAGI